MDVGAAIATPRTSSSQSKLDYTEFDGSNIAKLEGWIDLLDSELPPLKNFILPGGGQSNATLHLCRSICRRAERHIIPLQRDNTVSDNVPIFINRLSDFFFVAARYAAHKENATETIYQRVPVVPSKQ
eukprot:TRINITY_DN4873_c0_g1_i4.p1 TRINITY_DN4873_c0_g1~~TRINITY_DN4873_c0_g1_i4.p1  ORF type:complete len:128 (-),score=17.01 TRINITY_DN4873_c0_g1_i4:85-468(-)